MWNNAGLIDLTSLFGSLAELSLSFFPKMVYNRKKMGEAANDDL